MVDKKLILGIEKDLFIGIVAVGLVLLAAFAYFTVTGAAVAIVPPGAAAVIVPVVPITPSVPIVTFIGVTTVSPLDLSKNQGPGNSIVVTFSEAMNPTTVNQNTFMVKGSNGVSLQGVISSDVTKKIWTFDPTFGLISDSVYTITVTTGAKGVSGNSLAKNFVSSFTTNQFPTGFGGGTNPPVVPPVTPPVVVPLTGPAAVNLGTAGNFVILAKSAVSTTGTTSVVGDIGVSPAAASFITGFGLIMDSSNTYSTSSLVTGKVYAADYTPPTPAYMTTAISDMETAFTAANSPAPDATELGAGDISGMTLYPGTYKWGTGLLISSVGLTLDCRGNANDVYIFQIAQTLTVESGAIVTLSGGCQAKNIFWAVAGQSTLGTTSQFKGTILDQTAVVLETGAVLNGRALAQTAVTLDANTVTS